MNVLKRNYRSGDLEGTTTANLDTFVQYLVREVLPVLGDLSPNLLTLPFLVDLVLKNNKFGDRPATPCSKTLSAVADNTATPIVSPVTSVVASTS